MVAYFLLFLALFYDLDTHSHLGVISYGVSMTTLEDVFLKLEIEAEIDQAGEKQLFIVFIVMKIKSKLPFKICWTHKICPFVLWKRCTRLYSSGRQKIAKGFFVFLCRFCYLFVFNCLRGLQLCTYVFIYFLLFAFINNTTSVFILVGYCW